MNRRNSLLAAFAVAFAYTLAGPAVQVHAQAFAGKWVHRGAKGVSVLEFYQGERHIIGPMKGVFHHSLVLDDGKVIQGDGQYVFRSIGPNRGWLILHFADGHVTREHEHVLNSGILAIRHHGFTRQYIRE